MMGDSLWFDQSTSWTMLKHCVYANNAKADLAAYKMSITGAQGRQQLGNDGPYLPVFANQRRLVEDGFYQAAVRDGAT